MNTSANNSHSYGAEYRKKIIKVFLIIAVLTLLQIIWAVAISDNFSTATNAPFYFLLTMIKVYYLLSEFMHLKYESRSFRISVLSLPVMTLIWFVISFCYEGDAGLDMQNKYNARRPDIKFEQPLHESNK